MGKEGKKGFGKKMTSSVGSRRLGGLFRRSVKTSNGVRQSRRCWSMFGCRRSAKKILRGKSSCEQRVYDSARTCHSILCLYGRWFEGLHCIVFRGSLFFCHGCMGLVCI